MFDPHPAKALLTAREVAHLLSMGAKTFLRFRGETPTFPKPIWLGKPGGRGDRLRWRKVEVLVWVLSQPAHAGQDGTGADS